MTLTIDLSPEEEAQLREKAKRQGQDALTYAANVLRYDLQMLPYTATSSIPERTLAETLAGRIGLFRSAEPSDMARNSEEEFGKIMDEKKRQGHV